MTWAEFKSACEAQGVKDDDEIAYIDIGCDPIYADWNPKNGWQIT